jgi:hypothetical protein
MTIEEYLRQPCVICGDGIKRHIGRVNACFGGLGTSWSPQFHQDGSETIQSRNKRHQETKYVPALDDDRGCDCQHCQTRRHSAEHTAFNCAPCQSIRCKLPEKGKT